MSSRLSSLPLFNGCESQPQGMYLAALVVGKSAFLYFFCECAGHAAALESAVRKHQQFGYDVGAVTSAYTYGRCTNPKCDCRGRVCAVHYDFPSRQVSKVVHH